MAIPVTDVIQLPPIAVAASSYPVTIPASISDNWANDDWVFLAVSFGVTSGTATLSTASSGWTEVVENGITIGAKMAIYKAKVSGGTVADPTIDASTGTGVWQGVMWVERGLDGTTPVLSTATAAAGSLVNTLTTGTLTPANNNAHVYYFAAVCSGSLIYTRFLDSEIVGEVLQSLDNGTVGQTIVAGSWQQGTAAATAKTLYASAVGRLGCITMALNDAVTTQRAQHASVDMTRIAWGGTFGNQHDGTLTPTVSSWNGNPASRTIDGTAVSTTGGTVDLTSTSNTSNNEWGFYTAFASTLNADNWQGNMITFAADVDLSGGVFSVEFAPGAVNNAIGTKGWIIVFENNAGTAWAAFRLSSKVGLKPGKSSTILIDLENAVPYSSELGDGVQSALDWTTVRKITPLVHRSGLSATSRTFFMKNFLFWRSVELTGGSSDLPQTINYLRKAMQGWGYDGLVGGESPAATLRCDTFIGDGTTPTYYDATGTLHGFPAAYDFISSREVNIPANALTLTVKTSASDTVNLTATSISAPIEQNFVYDATSSGSAVYSTVGAAVSNMATTLLAGETFIGLTASGCAPVNTKGSNLTSFTVADTTATASEASVVIDVSGSTLSGGTTDVTGTAAGYHLELASGVKDISLINHIFTGTAATNKVHVLKTSATVLAGAFVTGDHYEIKTVGTTDFTAIGASANTIGVRFTATGAGTGTGTADQAVKITISGTTSLIETDVTTAGAPVWIAAPQPNLDATVLSGTRVVLYNNTTTAELDNTAPAGTSWSKTITGGASANDNLTLFAFKEGYAEFSTSFLYSGEDTTILVTQVVDDVVAAFRTEDSITDYTTLTEYNIYAPTIYIQADDADGVSKISRLATYYNGILTTEDGARYFRGGMSMISTGAVRVNKSVIELLLENVSATKSLRFSDEATRRLYTDDGTSIIAPSSVAGSIEYAYGGVPDTVETGVSGLTAPESAQLMGLPSSTAIAAAVWAYVVEGSTTALQWVRLVASVLLGKVSGAGTGTETFRDLADTKDRVVSTVDNDGNRTTVARDGT